MQRRLTRIRVQRHRRAEDDFWRQQRREADRRRHNLIRAYIGQPLLLPPMVLLYTRITVEQWMDPGGSNDERLTDVDTRNCYIPRSPQGSLRAFT